MDFLDFDAESVMFGALIGLAAGCQAMYWFIQWARCKNCCWTDKEKK